MLPQQYRLKERQDFRRVYRHGEAKAWPYFVLYRNRAAKNSLRIGFSVSKKLGCAVTRNRVKRQFRAACRLALPAFAQGYDYIFIVRQASCGKEVTALQAQILRALSAYQA